ESQRITRAQARVAFLERALVGERGDPLPRGDAKRISALGTDPTGAVDLGAVDDLLAGAALGPQALGDDDLFPPFFSGFVLPPPERRHQSDCVLASRNGAFSDAMKSPTWLRSSVDSA